MGELARGRPNYQLGEREWNNIPPETFSSFVLCWCLVCRKGRSAELSLTEQTTRWWTTEPSLVSLCPRHQRRQWPASRLPTDPPRSRVSWPHFAAPSVGPVESPRVHQDAGHMSQCECSYSSKASKRLQTNRTFVNGVSDFLCIQEANRRLENVCCERRLFQNFKTVSEVFSPCHGHQRTKSNWKALSLSNVHTFSLSRKHCKQL